MMHTTFTLAKSGSGLCKVTARIKAAHLPASPPIPLIDGRVALGTSQGTCRVEHRTRPHRRSITAPLR